MTNDPGAPGTNQIRRINGSMTKRLIGSSGDGVIEPLRLRAPVFPRSRSCFCNIEILVSSLSRAYGSVTADRYGEFSGAWLLRGSRCKAIVLLQHQGGGGMGIGGVAAGLEG